MLTQFGPDIWTAEGPCVAVLGFRYPTRMTVIRLPGGGVALLSPIPVDEDLRTEVEALGPVRHILAPNALHHLWIAGWAQACPGAELHAAPGLRAKRKDLAFDHDLGDQPHPDWAGAMDQVPFRGNAITTEIVFFHAPSGTVIFTDLLQHFPQGWFSGWRGLVARLDLMTAREPSVPRKFRLAFTDRRVARDALARIRAWPAQAVLMAHGAPVASDAAGLLDRAFRWLAR